MNKLFGTQRIEDYLMQVERNIKNQIDRLSEQYLNTLDVEEAVDKLIVQYKITTPVLDTSKTKSTISTEQISGHQLPPGTAFQMGKKYDIEIANYQIPFSGTAELFECSPTVMTGLVNNVIVNVNGFILIQLTNWGKLSGNDKAIEGIKLELLGMVERIDKNLKNIENDVFKFNDTLKPKLVTYLTEKVKRIRLKNESSDKLNPFL